MIIESILLNTMLKLQHVDQTSGIVPLYYFNFFQIFSKFFPNLISLMSKNFFLVTFKY